MHKESKTNIVEACFTEEKNKEKFDVGLDCKRAKVGGMNGLDMQEFHRFGMLWDENGYPFYVDGVEDGHISQYISRRTEFILISTEVKGCRYNDHQPVKEAFDIVGKDSFPVDYVRVFDRED